MDLAAHAPTVGDAFGEALRRCHRGRRRPGVAFEVVERDDGLIDVGDAATYFAPLRDWPPLEREVYPEITGRVLDLGCGAGRHTTVLAADGIHILGVDPSPGAVDVTRDRGANAWPGSATELPDGIGTFDTFLLLGNNVGLLGGSEQAPLVLAELAQVATPSARVIMSGTDPYATDDPDHLTYHARNQQRGRMSGQLRMRIRHERITTPWFDYLLCSETELAELVADSPWRLAEARHDNAGNYIAVMELHAGVRDSTQR